MQTDYHTLFAALKLAAAQPISIAETVASYAVATAIDLQVFLYTNKMKCVF
jgi:pyruvate kinase